MRLLFTLLRAILLGCACSEPAAALDPARSMDQYKHTVWSVDDGAPRGVSALAQGASGYLWIGSSAGLFRFDGNKFEPIAQEGAETRLVSALTVLPDGDVWVGYAEGGTAVFRHGVLRTVPMPNPDYVEDFARTRDGCLWATLGRSDHQLMRFHDGQWQEWGPRAGFPAEEPTTMIAAQDGSLWITTSRSLLVLGPQATRFERLSVTLKGHASLAQDRQGHIWLSDAAGSRMVDRATNDRASTSYPTPTATRHVQTLFDRDGNLWGIADEAVFRLRSPRPEGPASQEAGEKSVDLFSMKKGMFADRVGILFEDREGDLWVGMAFRFERIRPARVVPEPLLTKPAYWGDFLLGARDGTVYVGEADGIYRIEPGGSPEMLLRTTEPQALCEGPDRSIWIVLQNGIARMKMGAISALAALSTTWPFSPHRARDCMVDRNGRIWVAAESQGLMEGDEAGWRGVGKPTSNGEFSPQILFPDENGRILVLSEDRSIAALDPPSRFQPIISFGEDLGRLRTLHPSADGLLVGARSGLIQVKDGVAKVLSVRQYKQFRSVAGIVQTETGQTWISGPAGIYAMSSSDLDRAFKAPGTPVVATVLDTRDGLPGPQPRNAIRALVQGGDGRIWLANGTGTAWIDPAHLPRNTIPPPTAISAVKSGENTFHDPSALELRPGQANIEIDFAALSLSIPERVKVLYQLVGADAGWIDPGSRRQAFYTNLGPGHYVFRVIAANDDGVWNRTGSALNITIPPTFLQSIWFKLLLALAGIALLWCAYLVRVRQLTLQVRTVLETRMAERERIARDLHDTLLQGFQGLILTLQAVANEIPRNQRARGAIEHALESADAVLGEGRDSVRQLRAADVADLADRLAGTARQLMQMHPLEFRMTVEGSPRPLDPVVRSELFRIGDEALTNAFRHSGGTAVELAVSYRPSAIVLDVRDDGRGIDPAILEHGGPAGHFGLLGMRERAAQIKADLQVLSRPDGGTEIKIAVPASVAYAGASRAWRLIRLRGIPS